MNITVVGCGRWGSFIAWYLSGIGHKVTLYGRSTSKDFAQLSTTRTNEYVTLPDGIALSCDIGNALAQSDCAIISISGQNLRQFMGSIAHYKKPLVLCMKGIEASSGLRLSQIAAEFVPEENIAVWVGPGHIQCFTKGIPNCMLIDSTSRSLALRLASEFKGKLIKFYVGDDLIGSEIGAAAKNVIGIAAGMLDGANLTTLKGALMARGAREVARLIKALGGNELSAYGLCHLGDYETTLFSEYSHNRAFGEAFVKKQPFSKLAEGVATTDGLRHLAKKYRVDMPITNALHYIIGHNTPPDKALMDLFARENQKEF